MAANLLMPAQAGEILGIKESQVYTLMRNGSLKAVKIGARGVWRIHPDDLDEYVAKLRADAAARSADELTAETFEEAD